MKPPPPRPKAAVRLQLERAFANMAVCHGFIHAAPHPGRVWRLLGVRGRIGLKNRGYRGIDVLLRH